MDEAMFYGEIYGKISVISTPAAMTDTTCPAVLAPSVCIRVKFCHLLICSFVIVHCSFLISTRGSP